MLNFDMIGRNSDRPIMVHGDGFSSGMSDRLRAISASTSIQIQLQGRKLFPFSDHQPFYERTVPFLMFYTGVHDDYHRVTDHEGFLDYAKMVDIGTIAARLVEELSLTGVDPVWLDR